MRLFIYACIIYGFLFSPALAEHLLVSHALTQYGAPKYPANFEHFEYVNPEAPKGGTLKLAEMSAFDTLNPFTLKGVKAPGSGLLFESLMTSSLDEPQSMYGLVAESVTMPENRAWAEFTLRSKARWHDGTPITPEDVIFSLEVLKTRADPVYRITYADIIKAEKTGAHKVKFTFTDGSRRELPQIAALMPILSKTYYATHEFDKTTLESPLGSGPYKVASVDQGRSISYARVKDYWAKDLPVNRGTYNFDTIRYDIYRDETVALEAFKAGAYDFRQEYIARNWATAYDFPAIHKGEVIKRAIPDGRPQGMQAFEFNTRESRFADARVREAIGLAMDYEWLNKTIFYGAYTRNRSFFANTAFEAKGIPETSEKALLEPFRAQLPPALFQQEFINPVTDGSGNNRAQLVKADNLLKEAGWIIRDGVRVNARTGEKLTLEFLLRQQTFLRVLGAMRKSLERLGIEARVRLVDDSQYQKRVDNHDFDIISIWVNQGLFYPGTQQVPLWHSSQAKVRGSNNWGGIAHPVIDALLDKLTSAKDEQELTAAGRALDRVLQWEYYVIPHWHSGSFRVAYRNTLAQPKISPRYDVGLMNWWKKANP